MKEKKYRFWQIWIKVASPIILISVLTMYLVLHLTVSLYTIISANRISEIAWELAEILSEEEMSEEKGKNEARLNLETFHMVAVVYDQDGNMVDWTDVEAYSGDEVYAKDIYRSMLARISTQEAAYGQQDIESEASYVYAYGTKGISLGENYRLEYAGVTAPWMEFGSRLYGTVLLALEIIILITLAIAGSYYKIYAARMKMEDYYKFTANALAHDLKTPLMVVSGYAQNLLENVHGEKREHYAQAIVDNVTDMNQMVEGMLLFTDADSNHQTLQKEPVNLRQATEKVLEKYQAGLQKKEITVSIQGEAIIQAGKLQMNRVLDNLIGNAVKFTPPQETIEIVISEQGYRITNTGISIPKRKIKQLWTPFIKMDQTRNDGSGNGLGLAIVKDILEQHQFSYKLSSQENSVTIEIGFGC